MASDLISHIQNTIEEEGIDALIDTRPQAPEVVISQKLDDFAVFRLLVDLNDDVAPHPGNIMYCSSSTETADLNSFLGRVENFPTMKYFLVGVNTLASSLRETLLKWVSFSQLCVIIVL